MKKNLSSGQSSIYSDEELQKVWSLHQTITTQTQPHISSSESEVEESDISSIHDLVVQAVSEGSEPDTTNGSSDKVSFPWLTNVVKEKASKITAIASDIDGTLISGADQSVHPRTSAAVQRAVQAAFSPLHPLQWFFPATGKTRKGALDSLGPELAALIKQCPGVYNQGLYCIYNDKVIFEKKLDPKAVVACEKLVAETGVSIIAYDGDNLYTSKLTTTVRDVHDIYGEPLSEEIPSIAGHAPGVHKVLMVVDEADIDTLNNIVRPKLEAVAAANNARVTQAIPNMLELLPEGCSKALGVQKLCEFLKIDPSKQLLAIGDAENDKENLAMAALGVCVGNGSQVAKDAADIVLEETAAEGAAGLAFEVILGI